MPARRPKRNRTSDMQALKQALDSVNQAIVMFERGNDKDAGSQARLAWRFLDEFAETYDP